MAETGAFGEELERAIDKWRGQSRKGFLELCILACVRGAGRSYGFAMLESLKRAGIDIGEGSLYPLLTRLVHEGMLEAAWETPAEGHPRKYYKASAMGLAFLERVNAERDRDEAAYGTILSGACRRDGDGDGDRITEDTHD